MTLAVVTALTILVPVSAGASSKAVAGFNPTSTYYTGIDPGAGDFYTYAPSVVQVNATTRDVMYCGNLNSTVIRDHIMLTIGHLVNGRWVYATPHVVFGPENDPDPHGYFSYHACEPELIGGNFRFANTAYKWALFFTSESAPSNSTNQIGVAFANSPGGPWHAASVPIITTADDYGNNSYPNDCPTYPSNGQTFYCLGQPTATSIGNGKIVLAYTGNSGSPGNVSKPAVGIVVRELDLSNVPSGPCSNCIVSLPNGTRDVALTQGGLPYYTQNVALAYDAEIQRFVLTYDAGPENPDQFGPPVTPVVSVATISMRGLLSGNGTWQLQGNVGQCLSGYVYNHNSGIVRMSNGQIPPGHSLEVLYAVADNSLATIWGVWGYRIWDVRAPFAVRGEGGNTYSSAADSCEGLDLVGSNGAVVTAGSARTFGSSDYANSANPVVGFALTPDRRGYYEVLREGQVRSFGTAPTKGSAKTTSAVGMAIDNKTGGYWIASANGVVSSIGAARLTSAPVPGPLAAIEGIPNGEGYYVVTTSGHVSAFGHAQDFGSMTVPAGQAVAALAVTPTGLGYYVITTEGTIAAFGDAALFGPASLHTSSPITAMAVATTGTGYWVATAAGSVTGYGAVGSIVPTTHVTAPTIALAAY